MQTIYIAHGFRSKRHVEWVENARSRFEALGYAVQPVHYGYTHLITVRRKTIYNSSILANIAEPGSIGIGHSNGCELLLRACNKGAQFSHLVFINPALRPKIEICPQVNTVDVFYSNTDSAVVWGRRWRKMNPVNWFVDNESKSMWGGMGRVGYRGNDPRVRNHHLGPVGHSGALEWFRAPALWSYIGNCIEDPSYNEEFPEFK